MQKLRGRGRSPAKPIAVTAYLSIDPTSATSVRTLGENGVPLEVTVIDLTTSHTFSDFKLAKEDDPKPLCDLFDRTNTLPELPFSVGAYPEWNRERPYLTGQHLWTAAAIPQPTRPVQETELMDDLLYVFMGLAGQFVQPVFRRQRDRHQPLQFEIKAQVESSAQALLQRMMPLCDAVFVVQRFIETRSGLEYGSVCHALTAAMQGIMDDWMLLVTQLETQLRNGKLTLQTLWFYVQPAMAVLVTLAEICRQISAQELQGTELLNLLHAKMHQMSGAQNTQALLQKLLEAASVPYFEILEKWLCEGVIQDPYSEFMVEEDPTIQTMMTTTDLRSAYWLKRYQIRKTFMSVHEAVVAVHCVPSFLKQHADLVLTTGKYINAIRECGRHVTRPLAQNEHPSLDTAGSYLRLIQKAHKAASQAFLDLFVKDLKLVEWLRSMKHFFLMDQGDIIGHLMDIAEEELEKLATHVAVNRMQSLLEMAFKTSSLSADVNTEPLQVELDHRTLMDLAASLKGPRGHARTSVRSRSQSVVSMGGIEGNAASQRVSIASEKLTGWECFMIQYRIEWPMMLIVPAKFMHMYQLLFKQLFTLKRTEFELGKAWKALQRTRHVSNRSLDGALRLAQSTCYQMQHTVQQYLRHLTVHTVEPRWLAMEAALQKAKDVDKVIQIHQSFIEKVLYQSLLRKAKSVKELDAVISDSLRYAKFITSTLSLERLGWSPSSTSGITGKPSERTAERRRLLAAKIEAVLNSSNFEQCVYKCRADYLIKLKQLVKTLMDYCDMEEGETAQQRDIEKELQSREDLDKLINLIEMLKPRWR